MEAVASTEPFKWPPLESNPDIFNEYLKNLGLPAEWGIGEVYGFDEDCLGFVPRPVLAVIVSCERLMKAEDKVLGSMDVEASYFMKQTQVLDNACGIIACLHSILNNLDQVKLDAGSILGKYWEMAKDLDAPARATALENYEDF